MDRNTLINAVTVDDRSPHAADSMLEQTMNPPSRSPASGTQKCDIQEINEDNCQTHKIYQFQNCGAVTLNIDSFRTRGVRMEHCGNKVPQVATCHRVSGNEKDDENLYSQPPAVSSDGPRTSTEYPPQNGVDYVMLFSASLLVISCLMVFIVLHLCDVGGIDAGLF